MTYPPCAETQSFGGVVVSLLRPASPGGGKDPATVSRALSENRNHDKNEYRVVAHGGTSTHLDSFLTPYSSIGGFL